MAISTLAKGIGDSLSKANNQPGLASSIFNYPGASPVQNTAQVGIPGTQPAPASFVNRAVTTTATGPTQAQINAANAAAAQQAQAARDAQTGRAISAGYDQVIGTYDAQFNDIPNQVAAQKGIVDSQYDTQRGSVESAYGRGVANLDYARGDLENKTGRSIRDLSRSIRQSFDSYSTMLGANGAGDSSATGQLSYALQKAEAQNRSDIYQNQGDQLGQIALKQGDLDATHMDQLKQIDAWKAQQVISIGQQFKAQQMQIDSARAGATRDKLLALSSLNSQLADQAIAALSGVTAQHNQAVKAIQDSIGKLSADTSKLTPTFDAQAANRSVVPGMQSGGTAQDPTASFSAVPYYKRLQGA